MSYLNADPTPARTHTCPHVRHQSSNQSSDIKPTLYVTSCIPQPRSVSPGGPCIVLPVSVPPHLPQPQPLAASPKTLPHPNPTPDVNFQSLCPGPVTLRQVRTSPLLPAPATAPVCLMGYRCAPRSSLQCRHRTPSSPRTPHTRLTCSNTGHLLLSLLLLQIHATFYFLLALCSLPPFPPTCRNTGVSDSASLSGPASRTHSAQQSNDTSSHLCGLKL